MSPDNTEKSPGTSGDEEEEGDHHDEDDDGGGWITPGNIKQIQQDMGVREAPDNVVVGCLTTDFAMQVSRHQFSVICSVFSFIYYKAALNLLILTLL